MKKRKKSGVWGKLLLLLSVVAAIILGGFFFIDKLIVPSYFKGYGINGMGDLFGVITTLYNNPKEKKIVSNGYSSSDWISAADLLKDAGYNIDENKEIIEDNFNENGNDITLSDKQFAAICNKLLKTDLLDEKLSSLRHFDLGKINVLQINVDSDEQNNKKATIDYVFKINTSYLKTEISKQMQTPQSILDILLPATLYFSGSFDIDLTKPQNEQISNAKIIINDKQTNHGTTLISLLIGFIYPDEEKMNLEKFEIAFANVVTSSIELLGECQFLKEDNLNILKFS